MNRNLSDRIFAGKIAIFNSLGFLLCTAGITYVDPKLKSLIEYGPISYAHGYLVASLGSVIILVTTYYSLLIGRFQQSVKLGLPLLILLVIAAIATPFFYPKTPHPVIVQWTLELMAVTLMACFIRNHPVESDKLKDNGIPEIARIEWIKEHASLWRIVSISLSLGVLALITPWTKALWGMSSYIVSTAHDKLLLGQFGGVQVAFISIYILLSPIYESFHKAQLTSDLLLKIKKGQ